MDEILRPRKRSNNQDGRVPYKWKEQLVDPALFSKYTLIKFVCIEIAFYKFSKPAFE